MRAAHPAEDLTAAVAAAAEAVHLRDLSDEALPSLQRAVGASNALLYRYGEGGVIEGVAGSLRDELSTYTPDLIAGDPLQRLPRALPPGVKVVLITREVELAAYRRSDAYHGFYRPHDVEHVVCTWITGDRRYAEPGMTGILLSRAVGQDPFSDRERRALEEALPAFAAAARRSARVEASEGRRAALEAVAAGAVTRPVAALAPAGRVLWMSPAAAALLGPKGELPAALVEEARRLGALAAGQRPARLPAFAGAYALPGGGVVRADLALARTAEGEVIVRVELGAGPTARERALSAIAADFELTRAETEVLGVLARGLTNREIAGKLCVSVETVRTHVARILHKTGVGTRTQAALLVREREEGSGPAPRA
jgi:DNA-binding CsgD family transcriptional regulator